MPLFCTILMKINKFPSTSLIKGSLYTERNLDLTDLIELIGKTLSETVTTYNFVK